MVKGKKKAAAASPKKTSPKASPKKKTSPKKKAAADVKHRKGTVTNMAARVEATKTEYARDKGVSIPRAAFARVVRSTLAQREGESTGSITRIAPKAILALQIFAEQSVGDHINRAAHIAEAVGNTKTLMVKHFDAAEKAFHVSGGAKLDALEH